MILWVDGTCLQNVLHTEEVDGDNWIMTFSSFATGVWACRWLWRWTTKAWMCWEDDWSFVLPQAWGLMATARDDGGLVLLRRTISP